jgi:hypothetical protein
MNWRRGSLRLYAVAVVIWIAIVLWRWWQSRCIDDPFDPKLSICLDRPEFDYQFLIWAVVPPVIAMAVVLSIMWIVAGFKPERPLAK